MSKPTDKGDYGLNPSEEEKERLLRKEMNVGFNENDEVTDNSFESGDNPEERKKIIENAEEARELGEEGIKSPKGENL
jgi:hypothetical protein